MQNVRVGPIVNIGIIASPDTLYMSEPFRRNIQCIGFYCSGKSTSPVYESESGSGLCIIEPFVWIYSVLVSTVLAKAPHMCIDRGRADTLYMIEPKPSQMLFNLTGILEWAQLMPHNSLKGRIADFIHFNIFQWSDGPKYYFNRSIPKSDAISSDWHARISLTHVL